jgi:hypothetical protein
VEDKGSKVLEMLVFYHIITSLLQNAKQINGDNLNNVRRETSRNFRNIKKEFMKDN